MGRTSAIPACEEGTGDLYETMLKHSTEVRWHILAPGLLSTSAVLPDRETAIADYMSVPHYTPTRDARGYSVMGEPHWPTREEAERAITACESRRPHIGGASLIQSSNGADSHAVQTPLILEL